MLGGLLGALLGALLRQKGGESSPVITPGNPETSLLIKAVCYTDKELQMPPKKKPRHYGAASQRRNAP